jgi:hypothetical protein
MTYTIACSAGLPTGCRMGLPTRTVGPNAKTLL